MWSAWETYKNVNFIVFDKYITPLLTFDAKSWLYFVNLIILYTTTSYYDDDDYWYNHTWTGCGMHRCNHQTNNIPKSGLNNNKMANPSYLIRIHSAVRDSYILYAFEQKDPHFIYFIILIILCVHKIPPIYGSYYSLNCTYIHVEFIIK